MTTIIVIGRYCLYVPTDCEESVVDKEKKISSFKRGDKTLPQEGRRGFLEPSHISKKDPPLGKVSN